MNHANMHRERKTLNLVNNYVILDSDGIDRLIIEMYTFSYIM